MKSDFFNIDGDIAKADKFKIEKARDLALKMQAEDIDYTKLVECRKHGATETVVFDVDVEVPQIPVHSIKSSERIAVTFLESDDKHPIVNALRKDFPLVPHLNLEIEEYPRSLCLTDQDYEEQKRSWTSKHLIERIREWLAKTALGKLHGKDQPLEPILLKYDGHLVLPQNLLKVGNEAQPLSMYEPVEKSNFFRVIQGVPKNKTKLIIASIHSCIPQKHGVIRQRPKTLAELAALTKTAGLDLLYELRDRLKNWDDNKVSLDAFIILVIHFPKKRTDKGKVETHDPWAFLLGDATGKPDSGLTVRDLGIKIGLWEMQGEYKATIINTDTTRRGDDINVGVLNVSLELNQKDAAMFNGKTSVNNTNIATVGIGALGSQVVFNLARSGFGTWTLIDSDLLMSHNVARHALSGYFIGHKKAAAVARLANTIVTDTDEELFSSLDVDVLKPEERYEEMSTVFRDAEAILDMSASVSVARKLSLDVESSARRISLFMTPSGQDIVLLAEDNDRTIPLDALEMQYYRAVANEEVLAKHFKASGQRNRYGQSCRDVTRSLPQSLVALLAATGSQAIENVITKNSATIAIWHTDDAGNVQRINVTPNKIIHHQTSNWKIVTDQGLMQKLNVFRETKLPDETGGVLLGSFDLERKIVYIVDALPSPPDSEEWPTLYIRGSEGLLSKVEALVKRTHGMLEYIGEWHSHPRGARTGASVDDKKAFTWLTDLMDKDGFPAVTMIVGDHDCISCYVGEIMSKENLLPKAVNHE